MKTWKGVFMSVLWVTLTINLANAQSHVGNLELENPYKTYRETILQGNYLKPLLTLKKHEKEYLDSRFQLPYLETMVLLNYFVNKHKEAYAYDEKIQEYFSNKSGLRERNKINMESYPIDSMEMTDARLAIIKAADSQQVLMFNEEHRHPLHRTFLESLLPQLYTKGFRYLALEALAEEDPINQRGYPTQESGYYTADPVFSRLLRTALDLGFTLIPYEYTQSYPEGLSPEEEQDIREKGQAQNIFERIVKKHPESKVIVLGGRSHIAEVKLPEFSFMAYHFKNITGIDPFTIDQTILSPYNNPLDEKPLYRYITKKYKPDEPKVFQQNDNFFSSGSYDMQVIHPLISYTTGRPDWQLNLPAYRQESIDMEQLKLKINDGRYVGTEALIVEVSKEGESKNAVPLDIILIEPNKEIRDLLLPHNKEGLMISLKDENGEVLASYGY